MGGEHAAPLFRENNEVGVVLSEAGTRMARFPGGDNASEWKALPMPISRLTLFCLWPLQRIIVMVDHALAPVFDLQGAAFAIPFFQSSLMGPDLLFSPVSPVNELIIFDNPGTSEEGVSGAVLK